MTDKTLKELQEEQDDLYTPGLPEKPDDGQPCILTAEQQSAFDSVEEEIIRQAMTALGKRKTTKKSEASARNWERARQASMTPEALQRRREGQQRRRDRERAEKGT